jgi:hypothetical protein
MGGFITKKTVLANPVLIIRLYGFRMFIRFLTAQKGSTFLGILMQSKQI